MSDKKSDYLQLMHFTVQAIDQLNQLQSLIKKQDKNNRHANELAFLILARTSLIISSSFTRVSYQLKQTVEEDIPTLPPDEVD